MDTNNANRVDEAIRVTKIGAVINIVLVITKIVLGYFGGSRALIADGLHSMTDLVSDAAVMVGVIVGAKPRDEDHHYGHGKVENLSEMVLGIILVFAGLFIAVDSVSTIFRPNVSVPSYFVIPVAAASIISKEWLYRITVRTGRKFHLQSLIANAWHHRSDAITSAGVLLGVTLAVFIPKFAMADAAVGFLIAIVIVRIGGKIGWDSAMRTIDTAPGVDYELKVERMILEVPGALAVREMKFRYVGNMIAIEAHVGMDSELTVREGHDIATAVKRSVMERDSRIYDVVVHVEPEED
jgi:cation diffusion facilitator family transporter